MRCLLYVRYSPRPKDKEVDKVESLEFQEAALRDYFHRLEIEVAEVIADPMTSARKTPLRKRPQGQRLLSLTTGRRPSYSIIGAYRLDRLFRSVADGAVVLEAWRRAGTVFHLSAEGGQSLNSSTATGMFLLHTRLAAAQFEGALTAERTSDAMIRMQGNGRRMSAEPPFGMMHDPADPARLVECPAEQELLRRVVELHEQGLTPDNISTRLIGANAQWRTSRPHPEKVRRALRRLGFLLPQGSADRSRQ